MSADIQTKRGWRGELATIRGTAAPELTPFARQQTVLLTTYRRNGTPVGTPVHIAVAGDRAYVRTYDRAGKLKRIWHNPAVAIAPSTLRGTPTGPAIAARARILTGAGAAPAAQALAAKYPILHGALIPWYHRLRGYKTVHVELRVGEVRGRGTEGRTGVRAPLAAPTS